MCRRKQRCSRLGITLAETAVVLAIVAILVALLIPLVLQGREAARRTACEQRIGGLLVAIQMFENQNGYYPVGVVNETGPIASEPRGNHQNWIGQILPYVEDGGLAVIDQAVSVYDPSLQQLRSTRQHFLICPSDQVTDVEQAPSSYAACHHDVEAPIDEDNWGVFILNRRITTEDILDGLAFTLFLGEKRNPANGDLGWLAGTRATLRNTGTPVNATLEVLRSVPVDRYFVGGFGSWHVAVMHTAHGDGRVAATSISIEPTVYRQLGNRTDGTSGSASARP